MEDEPFAAAMQRDGYFRIPQLVGGAALTEAREHCRRLLAGEIACGGDDRQLGGRVRQIVLPSRHHRWFAHNPVIAAVRVLCAQIWQTPAEQVAMFFDMFIAKDPGNTAATPWHQDFAYDQMPYTPPGVPASLGGQARGCEAGAVLRLLKRVRETCLPGECAHD